MVKMPASMQRLKDKRPLLASIPVLVVENDGRLSNIVMQVLKKFGFYTIHLARTSDEALLILQNHAVDIMITEWILTPISGLDVVSKIRNGEASVRSDLPVIMLTGQSELHHVQTARDNGVTEYVLKPFTAQSVAQRLIQVIDNPRSFVQSKNFTGPDRRRKRDEASNPSNRRMPLKEIQDRSHRDGDRVYITQETEIVVIADPNQEIRAKLGDNVRADQILTPEVVQEAQNVVRNSRDDYIQWARQDIEKMERAIQRLQQDPEDKYALEDLIQVADAFRTQAGTFGFELASAVGKSLFTFLWSLAAVDASALTVVHKHMDTLYVIFHHALTSKTELNLGNDVLVNLRRLIDKHAVHGTAPVTAQ